jgi:hypothetical protein
MKIEKSTAKLLYPESPDWFQKQLENEFGSDFFKTQTFEEIKTFEDACRELGINPINVINGNDYPDEIAYKKLKIVIKAINKGWIPDLTNRDQEKWFPIFNLSSGFGFSNSHYRCTHASPGVGSRLCFESEEKSNYAATHFIELYREFLTLTK